MEYCSRNVVLLPLTKAAKELAKSSLNVEVVWL